MAEGKVKFESEKGEKSFRGIFFIGRMMIPSPKIVKTFPGRARCFPEKSNHIGSSVIEPSLPKITLFLYYRPFGAEKIFHFNI